MHKHDPGTVSTVLAIALAVVLAAGTVAAQQHDPAHADPAEAAEHGAAPAEDHDGAHGGGFHLDNLGKLVIANAWGNETAESMADWIDPIFSLLVALLIASFFVSVGRSLRDRDPTRRQIFAELVIGGLYGMFRDILGDRARRFAPYLGTLFIFILCNNLFGLVPLGHSSTASFVNTTLGLGLCTFLYVQYVGIRENGLGGYLYHFAGQPKSGLEWAFAIMIFPLELMGELIKPISLSLRLFGNIFGEDTLIAVMVILGVQLMDVLLRFCGLDALTPWFPGLPFQFPFYAIALIGSTVQALVFTLLSTIYISLMLPHGHEEEAH
ncbi:MAG TPA: F0F1 ATP synthase subunit A [Candidatus Krumholzibacteria bacterium]|nr:F0F1 ATP synthase subunit A [Candidatus Krumholzibacteria bacterium]HPD73027.1 F0F1 ATP synthase subunit A [Candidatus Krumholzibacteria bacterium]HRY41826.1 F0F1 ATP synthase subunit A [Candidatus Krumholzibacteria bacterium]